MSIKSCSRTLNILHKRSVTSRTQGNAKFEWFRTTQDFSHKKNERYFCRGHQKKKTTSNKRMTSRSILLSSAPKGKIHDSERRSVQFNKYVQTAIEDKLGNVSYRSKRLSRPASSTNFVRSTSAMLRGSFGGKRRGIGSSNNTCGSQSTNGSDRNNSLCSSASTIVEHFFEKCTMNAARWGSSKIASSVSISTDSYDSPLRPTSIRVTKTSTSKDTEHFEHMDNDFYFTVLNDTANKNVFDEDEDLRVMHQKEKKEEILSSFTLSIEGCMHITCTCTIDNYIYLSTI